MLLTHTIPSVQVACDIDINRYLCRNGVRNLACIVHGFLVFVLSVNQPSLRT